MRHLHASGGDILRAFQSGTLTLVPVRGRRQRRDTMGGILESLERLEPLVALVLLTANPSATCDAMLASISEGEIATVPELFTSQDLVYPALRYAGIIDGVSQPLQSARDQMLRLQTLVALRLGEANSWSTVVTVPPYLRASLPAGEIAET